MVLPPHSACTHLCSSPHLPCLLSHPHSPQHSHTPLSTSCRRRIVHRNTACTAQKHDQSVKQGWFQSFIASLTSNPVSSSSQQTAPEDSTDKVVEEEEEEEQELVEGHIEQPVVTATAAEATTTAEASTTAEVATQTDDQPPPPAPTPEQPPKPEQPPPPEYAEWSATPTTSMDDASWSTATPGPRRGGLDSIAYVALLTGAGVLAASLFRSALHRRSLAKAPPTFATAKAAAVVLEEKEAPTDTHTGQTIAKSYTAAPTDAYSMLWDDVAAPDEEQPHADIPSAEMAPQDVEQQMVPSAQEEEEHLGPAAPPTPSPIPSPTPSPTPSQIPTPTPAPTPTPSQAPEYLDLDALAASHPETHLPSSIPPVVSLPPTAIEPAHEATLPMEHTLSALQARLVAASKAARATADAAQRAGGYATAALAAASQASDAAQRANVAVFRASENMQQLTESAVAASEEQVAAAQRAVQALETSAAESAALAVAHQDVAASQSSVARRVAEVPAEATEVLPSTSSRGVRARVEEGWGHLVSSVQGLAEHVALALSKAWLWLRLWLTDAHLFVVQQSVRVQGWIKGLLGRIKPT